MPHIFRIGAGSSVVSAVNEWPSISSEWRGNSHIYPFASSRTVNREILSGERCSEERSRWRRSGERIDLRERLGLGLCAADQLRHVNPPKDFRRWVYSSP